MMHLKHTCCSENVFSNQMELAMNSAHPTSYPSKEETRHICAFSAESGGHEDPCAHSLAGVIQSHAITTKIHQENSIMHATTAELGLCSYWLSLVWLNWLLKLQLLVLTCLWQTLACTTAAPCPQSLSPLPGSYSSSFALPTNTPFCLLRLCVLTLPFSCKERAQPLPGPFLQPYEAPKKGHHHASISCKKI